MSPSKLGRISTLYLRDESYIKARAQIANYHHEPLIGARLDTKLIFRHLRLKPQQYAP